MGWQIPTWNADENRDLLDWRVNIGNALLFRLPADLHLQKWQTNIALSVFFISYVAFEIPANILLKKVKPHIFREFSFGSSSFRSYTYWPNKFHYLCLSLEFLWRCRVSVCKFFFVDNKWYTEPVSTRVWGLGDHSFSYGHSWGWRISRM